MTSQTTHPARHRLSGHQAHLPVSGPGRIAAVIVAAAGAALIVITFTNNLFNVGPSFENLMNGFRPHLTTSAIATSRADIAGLGAAGTELQTKMMPAVSQQLGMTPAQFNEYVSVNYPQVSAGIQQLPGIVTTFNGLITTLNDQRPLFASADAIPTKDLPATTVPWGLAGAGVLMVAAGVGLWFRPRAAAAAGLALGLLLVAGTLAMTLPQKSSDADQLNANLKPVYTASLLTQAHGALGTVSAMGTQLQSQMLPALATQFKLTPAQLQQFLGQSFPATAAALQNLPTALPRFEALVTTFDKNLGNYNTLKPVTFQPIIWTLFALSALVAACCAITLVWPRHRVVTVA